MSTAAALFSDEVTRECDICAALKVISRRNRRVAMVKYAAALFLKVSAIGYVVTVSVLAFAK